MPVVIFSFDIMKLMLIVFTGNGKGKTTAALGQALRAVGRGKSVLMIQFIKGPWLSGEDYSSKLLSPQRAKNITGGGFVVKKMGKGFVGILGDKLPRKVHKDAANKALLFAEKALKSGKWDMIILDEINVALALKLLPLNKVLKFINSIPEDKLVIFTGRNAHPKIIKIADYVTEMKEIKHPFREGKLGQLGIEF
jgi:cob(I)alamin adenosyltransferase